MALRQLMIGRDLAALKKTRDALTESVSEIAARLKAWEEKEKQAEEALEEITDETTDEERAAFEATVAEIEKEKAEIDADKEKSEKALREAEERIEALEKELDELNEKAKPQTSARNAEPKNKNNGGINMSESMDRRARIRAAAATEEGKHFIAGLRASMQGRGITGTTLTIPTEMLPLLRETILNYSVLRKHVNVVQLRGDAKQNILGAVPEAVWTATTGKINELALGFNQVTVDGHKVAGYIPIPNPYIEDSDEDLAGIALEYIGQGIGKALDKAILYGTGSNMPIGIVTRLAAATSPTWWQTNMPAFTNLSTTHVGKLSAAASTGAALYKEMLGVLGTIRNKYAGGSGDLFWAMSEATWIKLQSELLTINAAGSVVTGAAKVMPIIGGTVEILDLVPDNNIVGGFGNNYLLAERRGIQLAESMHAQFIEDNTLYRGTARYDGIPVAGEAFAAFSLTTTAVTTSATFATDTANATQSAGDDT